MKVLIAGYGEMGHAMEALLQDRCQLSIWDIKAVPGHTVESLQAGLQDARFVLLCVPVTPLAGLLERMAPDLPADCISISIAKGLDESARTAAAIFREVLADRHAYGVLYGPMIAEEIQAGRPAYAQAGCSAQPVCECVDELFAGSGLALRVSTDIAGISWSSVLKNVYALLFGVADGLALGDNVRGYLVVQVLDEMTRFMEQVGGDAATVYDLAGLGDLVTTATSADSTHHAVGQRLAHGETDRLACEGTHTLAMVARYGLVEPGRYPLFDLAGQLVAGEVEPARLARLVTA